MDGGEGVGDGGGWYDSCCCEDLERVLVGESGLCGVWRGRDEGKQEMRLREKPPSPSSRLPGLCQILENDLCRTSYKQNAKKEKRTSKLLKPLYNPTATSK